MNYDGIIFDLDQTLIDSFHGKNERKSNQWESVFDKLDEFRPYENVDLLLAKIRQNKKKIVIVTSNPREYCERIVNLWSWQVDAMITRDNVTNVKPDPEPFLHASRLLNIEPKSIVSIGDQDKDIIASRAAKIISFGALWGAKEPDLLVSSNPDFVCGTVKSLMDILGIS